MRILLLGLIFSSINLYSQEHPNLILTAAAVDNIRENLGKVPMFDNYVATVQEEVDAEIKEGVIVPIPKDMAGGYTHERHKRNFFILQKAGALYQILDEPKYAEYVKESLFEYARIYKSLPIHPQPRSYARGKLFWQCLNDSNWLVYVSQAYDCIYTFLTKSERRHLEEELFRPYADYISKENPQFFNRIHNHSTWGNAAVGMIGLVMNDKELIERALYGLPLDDMDTTARDNDGGRILDESGKAGFFANIDDPFSPDGYYTEGPYYQRYAMYPYLLFAVSLHNKMPESKIFEFKEGVLLKAVNALLNLTDVDGEFFLLNDAQKGMSYFSRELVSAVDIAYYYGDQDPGLLSIAARQEKITLDGAGFAVSQAIEAGKAKPFNKKSIELADGPKGNQGGVSIIRSGTPNDEFNLVTKYTMHGNSHGHFDKLSHSVFFRGEEILQDYGLARFVNIDQKNGGGYLKENTSWAKQSIAHNTLVINETSHFNGDFDSSSRHHPEKFFSDVSSNGSQIISIKERNAYPETPLHRTLIVLEDPRLEHSLLLDVFKANSKAPQQYDLPFHYFGQIMTHDFPMNSSVSLSPLGKDNGYQHLWEIASGKPKEGFNQLSWLYNNHFVTLSLVADKQDQYLFTMLGANDPNFNLRNDKAFVVRRQNTASTLFLSALEIHGSYSPVSELSINSTSTIKNIVLLLSTDSYVVFDISFTTGKDVRVALALDSNSKTEKHSLTIDGDTVDWTGPYLLTNKQ